MLKSKGILSYRLKDTEETITKQIAHIEYSEGLLSLYSINYEAEVLEEVYIYDPDRELWFSPVGENEYGEQNWEPLDVEDIVFKYTVEYEKPSALKDVTNA